MISRISGEVTFQDLHIIPQAVLSPALARKSRALPVPGWSAHQLGVHRSDRGAFDIEILSQAEGRIQLLLLAHAHPFYEPRTPADAERRAFHEGLIHSELAGQREFSWGEVLCRLDARANKDWLVLAFNPGPRVPLGNPKTILHLQGRLRFPQAA